MLANQVKKYSPAHLTKFGKLTSQAIPPQSGNNACYFYSRVDKEDYRFVSYHFIDRPERKIPSSMLVSLSDLWEGK